MRIITVLKTECLPRITQLTGYWLYDRGLLYHRHGYGYRQNVRDLAPDTAFSRRTARREGLQAPYERGGRGYLRHRRGAVAERLGEEVTAKTIAAISPWQFAAPLSPHRASALEGVALSLTEVTGWCEAWLAAHAASLRLIEGVGGVMVPLNNTSTTLDLMRALSLPALLVCGDYLGTYSHSLTAMAALNTANVPIRGMIVNQSETGVEHYETIASLRSFTSGRIPVVSLPRIPRLRESNDAFKEMREHPDFQDFFSFADSL